MAGRSHTFRKEPIKHLDFGRMVVLGTAGDGKLKGTDSLTFSIQPKAVEFVVACISRGISVLAEGDRLSNAKFFNELAENQIPIKLVYFEIDPTVARARALADGREFKDPWYKGRITKCKNIATNFACDHIDASKPREAVAEKLKDILKNDEFHECVLEQEQEQEVRHLALRLRFIAI